MNMKQNLKTVLGIILALLASSKFPAQNPDLFFEQTFPYQTTSHLPLAIFADGPYCYVTEVTPTGMSDGYYLMTVNRIRRCFSYETESVSPPLVYKISSQGELLGELQLGYDDRYSYVYNVYQAPDDPLCFLSVGLVHDNELHYDSPFMAKFDQDLNLLWRREVELPEPYHSYIVFDAMMDSDGGIFCSSRLYDCVIGNVEYSRFCFRLTPEGETDGLLDLPLQSYQQRVFEYPDGSGDYGLIESVEQGYQSELVLLRINRNMELVGQMTLPSRYTEMDPTNTYPSLQVSLVPAHGSISGKHATATFPDGSIILANEASMMVQDLNLGIYDHYNGVGIIKVNSEGEAVSSAMDGPRDDNDSLAMIVPMLPTSGDSYYFIYALGENGGYDYMNCFVFGKMDLEGNLLWRRYWNRYLPEYSMKIYYPQTAITSHDGGCLLTGFCFKSDINAPGAITYNPEVFLLKIFADGTFSVPMEDVPIRPYIFFPNPVEGTLNMEYSPDVTPKALEIYDLQGRLLRTQHSNFGQVGMEDLPAGTYTMRIVMTDGTAYSEKVIKQ